MSAARTVLGVMKRVRRVRLSGTGGVVAASGLLLVLVVAWLFLDGQGQGSAASTAVNPGAIAAWR